MAKIPPTSPMFGLSGRVGNLLYRQVNGETIVQRYKPSTKDRTERQKTHVNKMRAASRQAQAALLNPAVRAHYEKKKDKVNLPSPYVAALTDILRNGCIDEVGTSKRKAKGAARAKTKKND